MLYTASNSRAPYLAMSSWKDRWRCFTLHKCVTTGAGKDRWIWTCGRMTEWTSSEWRTIQGGNGWLAPSVETVSLDRTERRLTSSQQHFFKVDWWNFLSLRFLNCGWYLTSCETKYKNKTNCFIQTGGFFCLLDPIYRIWMSRQIRKYFLSHLFIIYSTSSFRKEQRLKYVGEKTLMKQPDASCQCECWHKTHAT